MYLITYYLSPRTFYNVHSFFPGLSPLNLLIFPFPGLSTLNLLISSVIEPMNNNAELSIVYRVNNYYYE